MYKGAENTVRKVILFVVFCFLCGGWTLFFVQQEEEAVIGSGELLRFHVIAHSDREDDQRAKLAVRDAVMAEMARDLEFTRDQAEARRIMQANEQRVMRTARDTLLRHGKDYPVRMEIGTFDFPVRMYGELVLPAGRYEAVRLILGDGKGRNWWCVLFPPLCMVDAAVVASQREDTEDDRTIEYRSKLAELIRE